ncbi:hypothetical protein SCARR_01669 [Pontiella sulfatireligans]|uniref:Uncharacterized protein n=1 Tax=Pontiella sulfatireligans TaxID=2750658 RepID=A0A6C2UHE4_9BACT|nr:hypothetical protein SCARR_01669 [Pontiella sulfatireligans]
MNVKMLCNFQCRSISEDGGKMPFVVKEIGVCGGSSMKFKGTDS